jgi:hypothetical protein
MRRSPMMHLAIGLVIGALRTRYARCELFNPRPRGEVARQLIFWDSGNGSANNLVSSLRKACIFSAERLPPASERWHVDSRRRPACSSTNVVGGHRIKLTSDFGAVWTKTKAPELGGGVNDPSGTFAASNTSLTKITEDETRDSHCRDWSWTRRRDCGRLVAT